MSPKLREIPAGTMRPMRPERTSAAREDARPPGYRIMRPLLRRGRASVPASRLQSVLRWTYT